MLRYCRRVLANNMTTTYLTFWMHDNYLGNTEWKEYETSLPPSHNHQVRDGANVHFLTGSVALQIAVVCMKDANLSATLQAFVKLWKIQHKLLQQVSIFHVNYRWPKAITKSFLVQHHHYRWLQLATWCHDTLPVWLGKGQMMLHTC